MTRFVPRTTRKRVKSVGKLLLYSICGLTVGVIAGMYTHKGLDSIASKTSDFIVELKEFDCPEASGWRDIRTGSILTIHMALSTCLSP